MDTNLEIYKLAPSEVALAVELIEMFGSDKENLSRAGVDYVEKLLRRRDFHVIVALENKKLVGGLTAYELEMFKIEATEMFLYEIEVAEAHRRRGIGKLLIEKLKEICDEKGIIQMFVGTEKDNFPAQRLYSSTGGIADEDSIWFNYYFG